MRPLYRKAVKDVTARKLRALLTILGIAVGVAGLTAITSTQGQVSSAIRYAEDASSAPDITYYTTPTRAPLAELLRQEPNIKTVQTADFVATRWQVPTGHKSMEIIGFPDLQHLQLYKFKLSEGRLPGPGEILMESSNKSMSPVQVGDRVTVQAGAKPLKLTVSGLVRSRGRPSSAFIGSALAYMRQADVQRLFGIRGVNLFALGLDDYSLRAGTAQILLPVFQGNHVTILQATVGHDATLKTVMGGILTTMEMLSIIAFLLSLVLLLSTIMTLVTEQVRAIGTMKAIGATRAAVMRNYLSSVAMYGVVGTIVGLVLGVLAASVLIGFINTTFTLDAGTLTVGVSTVVLAALVGIGVPVLAAVIPVYFGTRITVRDALAGYGVDRHGLEGHPVHFRRVRSLAGMIVVLPRTMQLGLRNLFRKRLRAALTILALGVSATAFLGVQTTARSYDSMINRIFDTYGADVYVTFNQPVHLANVYWYAHYTPNVDRVERMSQSMVSTQWGNALLTGLQPKTELYKKHLVEGRWFTAADRNVVVLSVPGANRSHLKVGDSITFHNDLYVAQWRVIGIASDYNAPGTKLGVMLASAQEVNRFRRLPSDLADGLMVRAVNRSQTAVNALSSELDRRLAAVGMQARVTTNKEQSDTAKGEVSVLNVMLYAVAVVVALVGAIGLSNTLAMSVLERRREIGILRSMGATGRKVTAVFWTESVTMSLIAWLIGVVLGIPAAYGFVQVLSALIMPVPFVFDPMAVGVMLVFVLIVATLASAIPVWGAARVRIAQTLRYEG